MRRRGRTAVEWDTASSDDDLVRWAQEGEREAFGVLYDRHVAAVYGYCYRRLGEREAAQDAAAETFRKALAALPHYAPQSFRGWIFAIARHVVVDAWRDRRPVVPWATLATVADPAASPEATALLHAEVATLATLLPHLSPEQQEVLVLRLSGLNPAEIGVVLGKSRNAIDMLQSRALHRLRELLAGAADPVAGGCHA